MTQAEIGLPAFSPYASLRSAGLAQASERWSRLSFGAALAFIANLYASPAFYWPEIFEPMRLGLLTSALCAVAVLMRRVTSGEPLRLGGPPSALLFAFMALTPLSFVWTIAPASTTEALVDTAKLLVVFVALLNALDAPRRIRTFLVVGVLATLAPSLGAIQRWMAGEALVEGFRTAWRGNYADPNRLAMGLVLFVPAGIELFQATKKPWLKGLLGLATVANVAAIVLTHSRSGAVALAVAVALTLARGAHKGRNLVVGALLLMGLVALAPSSFWNRSASIADYGEDASFAGRERAYQMLTVIVAERPFTGVGSGAFLDAWDRFAPLRAGGQHLIAHNIYMEVLGELGIPGLVFFGLFCVWLLVRLWRVASDPLVGLEGHVLLAGLAGYIVCELVNGYVRAFNLYAAFAVGVAILIQAAKRKAMAAKLAAE